MGTQQQNAVPSTLKGTIMKRTEYKICKDGERVATKYSWNTAVLEIYKIMKAQIEGSQDAHSAAEVSREIRKGRFNIEGGDFIWEDDTGYQTFFSILVMNPDQPVYGMK
jgi:hypothetical protein